MDHPIIEKNPELSLFLPVLDEEENLRPMHAKIQSALDALGKSAEVIYVDDGSTDHSLTILKEIAAADDRVRVISSRVCSTASRFLRSAARPRFCCSVSSEISLSL